MTATANTPASTPASVAPDAKPLPVLPGKRSTGKADRTGNPQADRAVRAATAAKKATPGTAAGAAALKARLGAKAAPKAPAVKKAAAPAPAPETPASAPKVTGAAAAATEAKHERATRRETVLATARTAPTATEALQNLRAAALNRGDRVEAAATATLKPWKAAAHPVGKEGDTIKCYGACGRVLPVSRFPYIGPKADGAGRYVECGRDQVDRLEVNKVRKAAGLPLVERPRVDAEHLGK